MLSESRDVVTWESTNFCFVTFVTSAYCLYRLMSPILEDWCMHITYLGQFHPSLTPWLTSPLVSQRGSGVGVPCVWCILFIASPLDQEKLVPHRRGGSMYTVLEDQALDGWGRKGLLLKGAWLCYTETFTASASVCFAVQLLSFSSSSCFCFCLFGGGASWDIAV